MYIHISFICIVSIYVYLLCIYIDYICNFLLYSTRLYHPIYVLFLYINVSFIKLPVLSTLHARIGACIYLI